LTTEGGGNFYGAEVRLINIANGNHIHSAIARSNIVRFTGVVYGVYDFEIKHPNYIDSELVSINVSQERVDESLNLTRRRANIVELRLRTSDGMPITNAKVTLRNNDVLMDEPFVYEVFTSSSTGDVVARLNNIAFGNYTLTVYMGERYYFIPYLNFEVQRPFVFPNEDEFFILHSSGPAEIARVTIPFKTNNNLPIVGAVVRLSNTTLTDTYYTQTVSSVYGATQAEVSFNGVIFGRYALTITLPGYIQHKSDIHINGHEINAPLITLSQAKQILRMKSSYLLEQVIESLL
jgi:hypothetical protein